MSGAGDLEFGVISWGWRGSHRIWRIRWTERPGQYAHATGPKDTLTAYDKAWRARFRLKFEPETDVWTCCPTMVEELGRTCSMHEPDDCPDSLVVRLSNENIGIRIHDGSCSVSVINYCPWCGTGLRRDEQP